MGEVLAVLGILLVVSLAVTAAVAGSAWRSLRLRNLVSRRHPTRAPLTWLASPARCARLHRRLRDAVAAVRAVVPRPRRRRAAVASPLATTADELEAQAAALDAELLVAHRLRGAAGNEARARLTVQVVMLERLAGRLAATAAQVAPPGSAPRADAAALAELEARLDALDAARHEVARLEASVGLRPTSGSAAPAH